MPDQAIVDPRTLIVRPGPGWDTAPAWTWANPAAATMDPSLQVQVDAVEFAGLTAAGGRFTLGQTLSHVQSVSAQMSNAIAAAGSVHIASRLFHTRQNFVVPTWVPFLGGTTVASVDRYRLVVVHRFVLTAAMLVVLGLIAVLGILAIAYLMGNPNARLFLRDVCSWVGCPGTIFQRGTNTWIIVSLLAGSASLLGIWVATRAGNKVDLAPQLPKPPTAKLEGHVGGKLGGAGLSLGGG
jgi:hypothetical protein